MKAEYDLQVVNANDINDELIAAWRDLESRAIESNGFLSPHFVLPAIKHLEKTADVFGLFVSNISGRQSRLTGVGWFQKSRPSKYFPLPHLTAFCSKHSLLSGLLADCDSARQVVHIIFDHLIRVRDRRHALVFQSCANEGPLVEIKREAAEVRRLEWASYREWERAILKVGERKNKTEIPLSKNARKSINRRIRRLEELGKVGWKIYHGENLTPDVIERFIVLENMGWKGRRKTSIASNSADMNFFREMLINFDQEGKAFITELTLNDHPISSTVNFISGKVGFAFKIGWDPSYSKYSPGILNEAKWLECDDDFLRRLEFIDSGSNDSQTYLNSLWNRRRAMRSGVYALTAAGKLLLPFVRFMAKAKTGIKSMRGTPKQGR